MFYGIEQSANLETAHTLVIKFETLLQAETWQSGQHEQVDMQVFRHLYQVPTGWRPPTHKALVEMARRDSTWQNTRSAHDILASLVRRHGKRIG